MPLLTAMSSAHPIPPPAPTHPPTLALLAVSTANAPTCPLKSNTQSLTCLPSNRALRHWTIHRAWRLYQSKLHTHRERELERQYNSMASACEALRLTDNHGLTAEDRIKVGAEGEGREMGRLYRIAMLKDHVWQGAPIEYARIQTESPGREGWNHGWTR